AGRRHARRQEAEEALEHLPVHAVLDDERDADQRLRILDPAEDRPEQDGLPEPRARPDAAGDADVGEHHAAGGLREEVTTRGSSCRGRSTGPCKGGASAAQGMSVAELRGTIDPRNRVPSGARLVTYHVPSLRSS